MNKIENVLNFSPQKEDVFIFDTNILIKVFYPTMSAVNSTPYIKLYEAICSSKSKIFISSIQISEFINRCIRFQFDLYKLSHSEIIEFKKDYRETDDYRKSMEAILEISKDILLQFEPICDNFDLMSLENLFLHSFSYDFNDAFIAELSRNYGAILVTDDKDYANFLGELHIITNNKTLMMFVTKK